MREMSARPERAERFFAWVIAHRLIVVATAAALLGVCAVGARNVQVDYTIEQLFPARGETRALFEEYKRAFSREDTRFSLVWKDSRPPGVALFRDMQRAADQFEAVGLRDVHWIGSVDVVETEAIDGELGLRVHPLIEEDRLSDDYVRRELARHRSENLYSGYLWNADQTAFAIHGYLDEDDSDDRSRRDIDEALAERLESLDLEGVTLAMGGIPVIRSRLPKLLEADQRLLLGGGFLLLLGILLLFFRHPGHVLLCLGSALPAYLVTIAVMGFTGISLTVLTSFIPIIVLVVGVSDAIHLLERFRDEIRTRRDGAGAVVATFSRLSGACFYTSLTTAVGFLALAGTRIGIVVEFGVLSAFAILSAFGFSMTLLPALLSLSRSTSFDDRGLRPRWIQRTVHAAAALAARPVRAVPVLFLAIGLLGLAAARGLRPNTLLLDDLQPRSSLLRDLRWIERNGFGLFQVNLYLRQMDGRPLHAPDALAWMARFQSFVSRDPLVVGTLGLPDYMKQLRAAALGDPEATVELPTTLEESSQLLLMAQLQDADFAEDVFHPVEGEAQIIVTVRDEGSVVILPFLDRVDRFLASNPPPVGAAAPTGTVYLLQSYQARILESFGPSIAIAIFVITGIMVYMFRSLKYGLLALVPNLFPLVVLLGAMRLLAFDLKPSTILVFSVAFGIAADDTIHLLGRFRRAVERGRCVRDALVESVQDTGPAILMTTVVVSAGFSLLMASQFEVLFLVGLMTVVSALSAVCADLFLIPSILGMGRRASVRRTRMPNQIREA
jgi:predicted RND superfamily exporter protein